MKDNYWKVRTSACIAVGEVGSAYSDQAFSILCRYLKDGAVNKQIVCETFVKLGVNGE